MTQLLLAMAKHTFEQRDHLERVAARIGQAITAFCRDRVGQTFHADELRAYVTEYCGQVAPGSADRVLRDLRQRGVLSYRVVSRKNSEYLVTK